MEFNYKNALKLINNAREIKVEEMQSEQVKELAEYWVKLCTQIVERSEQDDLNGGLKKGNFTLWLSTVIE